MEKTQQDILLFVDGMEISATFSCGRNENISRQIKQILLSSFAGNHIPHQGDILAHPHK